MCMSKLSNSTQQKRQLSEECEREDLVMFINTCFAATNQNEYYNDGYSQSVSVAFIHEYVLFNYRTVYARSLAVGINHFNQSVIILNLLSAGAPSNVQMRLEENALITTALRCLPANRAFGLLLQLAQRKINNRRSRALAKGYLSHRREPAFDAVKYKRHYRAIVRHFHIDVGQDFSRFLFQFKDQSEFETPLFETFRQAHYAQSAIYELPFTIAESFAVRHKVQRSEFLRKIEHKLTRSERLRLQNSAARASGKPLKIEFDPKTASLTRLVIYVLSLPIKVRKDRAEELHEMLQTSARRVAASIKNHYKKVALVADVSQSSSGSRAKAKRPLAIAIATAYLFEAASDSFRVYWAPQQHNDEQVCYPFLQFSHGQTALAEPIVTAMEWYPDLLLIVSDGWENDPPSTVAGVVRAAREKIPGVKEIDIVHANPVFDPEHFSPKPFSEDIATIGLHDAENIVTMLEFAAFASGVRNLEDLESYLYQRSQALRGDN